MRNFVRFGLNYAKVTHEFISKLTTNLTSQFEGTNMETLTQVRKGEKIVITEGSLSGLQGLYQC